MEIPLAKEWGNDMISTPPPAMFQPQKSPAGGLSLSLKRIVSGEELSDLEGRSNDDNAVNDAVARVPEEDREQEEGEEDGPEYKRGLMSVSIGHNAEDLETRRKLIERSMSFDAVPGSLRFLEICPLFCFFFFCVRVCVRFTESSPTCSPAMNARHDLHGPMSARYSTSGFSPKYTEEIFDLEHNPVKVRDNDAEFHQDSDSGNWRGKKKTSLELYVPPT